MNLSLHLSQSIKWDSWCVKDGGLIYLILMRFAPETTLE